MLVYFLSKADTPGLLADEDHAVAEAYGAGGERSMYGRKYMGIIRSAFLVDEDDRISHAWPLVKAFAFANMCSDSVLW